MLPSLWPTKNGHKYQKRVDADKDLERTLNDRLEGNIEVKD